MPIQWFPGHMHKAQKEMRRIIGEVDCFIELRDARIPGSSGNPMLAEIGRDKPCLRLLGRADLADPARTEQWLAAFDEPAGEAQALAVALHTDDKAYVTTLRTRLIDALNRRVELDSHRIRPGVALVVGIPNVGKSTLINLLVGRPVARTGNEPAITRSQQVVRLGERWQLRDTPGVLWPKLDNPASGYRLAATGAVKDTAMDSAEVASFLLEALIADYPESLSQRYGDDLSLDDGVETLECIGRRRGCLGAGGLIDLDRSARLVLDDFRHARLGRLTLETPAQFAMERTEVDERRRVVAEKRKLRKAARR